MKTENSKTYNGYVFESDESATLIEVPSFTDLPEDLTEVTVEMARDFLWNNINNEFHPNITKEIEKDFANQKRNWRYG